MRKIVVFGKGRLAIDVCTYLLEQEDIDLHVVPVMPEPSWTDSLSDWCTLNDIPYTATGNYKDLDFQVDLGISVFYDKIFKQDFISSCGQLINLHNSPLPLYRGVSPINWALKDNRCEHGISIHEITAGIDDGPILAQLKYSVYPEFDEVIDVYQRALHYGKILFEQTFPLISKIKPRPQNHKFAIYHDSSDNDLLEERRDFTRDRSLSSKP